MIYEVVGEASDGLEALKICREKARYSNIGCKMPLMDGLQTAKFSMKRDFLVVSLC